MFVPSVNDALRTSPRADLRILVLPFRPRLQLTVCTPAAATVFLTRHQVLVPPAAGVARRVTLPAPEVLIRAWIWAALRVTFAFAERIWTKAAGTGCGAASVVNVVTAGLVDSTPEELSPMTLTS